MSRTYSGLLIFEDLFRNIPQGSSDMLNLYNTVFTPNLLISEVNCGTTLGKFEENNYELEGMVELATDEIMSKTRINELLKRGIYKVATRHLSTCTAKGGICKTCFEATYKNHAPVNVLDRVNVLPEYRISTEIINLTPGVITYPIMTDRATYEYFVCYSGGVRITPVSHTDTSITLPAGLTEDTLVIQYFVQDTSPFIVWLAKTYSGSVLGMQALPSQALPVRPLLLTSILLENRLQLVSEFIKGYSNIPTTYSDYVDVIKDPLEKALYMLALYNIYSNVIS